MMKPAGLIPIAVFATFAVAMGFGLRNDPKQMPSQLMDRPLPEFELPALLDTHPGLSSQKIKGKVTLVNVFASWCPGCRHEHPVLLDLAKNNSFELVGIDWKDRPADSVGWLKRIGNPYTRVGLDRTGRAGINMGVTGVPETFVIGPEGRVRYRHAGPLTPEFVKDKLLPLIDEVSLRAPMKAASQ